MSGSTHTSDPIGPAPGAAAACALFMSASMLAHAASAQSGEAVAQSSVTQSATQSVTQSVSQSAPPGLENVGVDEHLGARIPGDAVFRDHTGRRVGLGDYVRGDRPLALHFVYHTCPTFCSVALDGVVASLGQQGWTVGRDFDVLSISLDPRDTPEVAADKRRRILYRYGRPDAEQGWHFLVPERTLTEHELLAAHGGDAQVRRVTDAVGFRFQWMARQRQFAHPGLLMLLTPDGRVARYLYGLEYPANDVRLSLLEASEGRSISTVERVILYCYRYDAHAQGYTLIAWRVMQIGGGLTATIVFGFLTLMWVRELRRRRARRAEPTVEAPARG